MPARWLAFLLVLALLPSAELIEQGVHVIDHLVEGDEVAGGAHHDGLDPSEEHGCTELVHVCGGHHGLGVTPVAATRPSCGSGDVGVVDPIAPTALHDLAPREPQVRPPIA